MLTPRNRTEKIITAAYRERVHPNKQMSIKSKANSGLAQATPDGVACITS